MDRRAVREGVLQVFSDHLALHGLSEDAHLFRDLKLDSIQQLTLVVELENRFRVRFGEADEAGIETVADVVELVARRLGDEA